MMGYENVQRELGTLTADIESLKEQMSLLRGELRETRDAVLQAKGGWKVMATLAGIAGGVAGFLVSAFKVKVGAS